MYRIYETTTFAREFRKTIPLPLQEDFRRRIRSLAVDPYAHGKPLRYAWFRELKAKGFRVYYLIEDTAVTIIIAGASDKKGQNATIARILSEYRRKH